MDSKLFQTKGIHIGLSQDTHTKLRILMFKKRISIQEVFEELATLIVNEDPKMVRFIDEYVLKKHEHEIDKHKRKVLSELEQDTIYSIIEDNSPLKTRKTGE